MFYKQNTQNNLACAKMQKKIQFVAIKNENP